jgi:hypothetical protein
VVDDFEVSAGEGLLDFFDFGFYVVDEFLDFYFLRDFFDGPVDAGDVGAVVEASLVAEKGGDGESVFRRNQQRVLRRWAGVRDDLDRAAGNVCFDICLKRFQGCPRRGE